MSMNMRERMIEKLRNIGEELVWSGFAYRAEVWPQNDTNRLPILVVQTADLRAVVEKMNQLMIRAVTGEFLNPAPIPDRADARCMVLEHPGIGRIVLTKDEVVCHSCREDSRPIVITLDHQSIN